MQDINILTIITAVGGVASSLMAVITLAILLIKPIRNKVRQQIEKESSFKTDVSDALKCLIRHSITSIYYRYRDERKIPEYEYQNLILLYDYYKLLKANTYIKDIMQIMNSWERTE